MSGYQFSEKESRRIEEVRSKAKDIARKAKKKSKETDLEEPSGKQTNPSEIDVRRDRKDEE